MKKPILTLLVAATSLAAFAQGKINMVNDSSHMLFMNNLAFGADAALAGQPVPQTLPSGRSILVDLYGGATAGTMSLQLTTTMSSTPGLFGPRTFSSLNLPGGVTAFMQIQIRDANFTTAENALFGGGYWGFSSIFTFTPSSTIAFNSIVNAGGSALSTWTAGNYSDLDNYYQIAILPVPEPSALALTGLGISALLLRRRCKSDV